MCLAGAVVAPELPYSRFFDDVETKPNDWLTRAERLSGAVQKPLHRASIHPSDAEWLRRVDETYPARARARAAEEPLPHKTGGAGAGRGLSNRPYWAVSRSQSVELTIRPASVHLRVSESRLLGEYDLGAGRSDKRRSKRGAIYEFSRRSRSKLQLMAADLTEVVGGPDLMLTLTYPGEWLSVCRGYRDDEKPSVIHVGCNCGSGQGSSDVSSCTCKPSGAVVKEKHLKAFRKFLDRHFSRRGGDNWGALWFFEFQTRGAPHIHVLPWGVGRVNVEALRKRAALAWSKIISHKDDSEREKHLKAGTGVERARAKHFGYACKYAAKLSQKAVPDGWGSVGRFWGVWNSPCEKPLLRSFYASAETCKRLCDGVLAAVAEYASEGFCRRVSDLFLNTKGFSVNLFGVEVSSFLRSYGVRSP